MTDERARAEETLRGALTVYRRLGMVGAADAVERLPEPSTE
ncbi:hypothetical protein ACFY00_33935 [Kitasatospora sp. NPDC001540]